MIDKQLKEEISKILMRLNVYLLEEPDYILNYDQATKKLLALIKKHERLVNKQKIGMLRQWLNEDRIKDAKRFVTNEDIETWLN